MWRIYDYHTIQFGLRQGNVKLSARSFDLGCSFFKLSRCGTMCEENKLSKKELFLFENFPSFLYSLIRFFFVAQVVFCKSDKNPRLG